MSDLRFNSIAGAVLASVLGVMGLGIGADALFHPEYPENPGYAPEVDIAAKGSGAAAAAAPAGPPDFGLVFADQAQLTELIARGEALTAQCKSCHVFDPGPPTATGPNLHDVFGRASASQAGFSYSAAMQGHNVNWSYLSLDEFLTAPARSVPGTQMLFGGLSRERDRMALIAYLRSISPNDMPLPDPLPPPEETAEGGESAPLGGEGGAPEPAAG